MGVFSHARRQATTPVPTRKAQPSPLQQEADNSPQSLDLKALQRMVDGSAQVGQLRGMATLQRADDDQIQRRATDKPNRTGLPDNLKAGIESLSGMSMDHVRVHRNSDKPATVQAHAYAQGSDIHLAPGQDRHLPHEAWHVVQQAQGRVKPTVQLQGVAVNDDAGLEAEADTMGAKAARFRSGASLPALDAGNNVQAAQLIGLRAYHPQTAATDASIQTMTMPAADYSHWGPLLQRRGIMHGAARAGDQMVVTQYATAPLQLFGWPSRRQLTAILLIGEGVLTVTAGIGAMVLTSGIAVLPAFMGALAGAAKIARGCLTWPAKNQQGEETKPTGKRLALIDGLRSLEGILSLVGGALAGNPKAIVFGAIKILRSLFTAGADYLRDEEDSMLRKGLMTISALLQFAEAGLVGAIGGDVIASAAEAPNALAEGLTVAGGAMTAGVGVSKAVRGGVQVADTYDYHKKGVANRPLNAPLLQNKSKQFTAATLQRSATGVIQRAQDKAICSRNLWAYNTNKMKAIEKKQGDTGPIVTAFLVEYPDGVPGHASKNKGAKPNQATIDAVAMFNSWYNAQYGNPPPSGRKKKRGR